MLQALNAAGIPCAPVNTVGEYMSDASLEAAVVLARVRIPEVDEAVLAGSLFEAELLPHERRPPPKTGEHTVEVLESLGYTRDEIDALRASGAAR